MNNARPTCHDCLVCFDNNLADDRIKLLPCWKRTCFLQKMERLLQKWLYYTALMIIRTGQTWLSTPVLPNFGKKRVFIKIKKNFWLFYGKVLILHRKKKKKSNFWKLYLGFFQESIFYGYIHGSLSWDFHQKLAPVIRQRYRSIPVRRFPW